MAPRTFLSTMGPSIQTQISEDLKLGLPFSVLACTRLEEDQASQNFSTVSGRGP